MKAPEIGFGGEHMVHHKLAAKLQRQLLGHVRDAIDWGKLGGFEQMLFCALSDEIDEDIALDLSRLLVTQCLESVIHDECRACDRVPFGVSKAERFAAAYEDGCVFCEVEAVERKSGDPAAEGDDDDHGEDCACCDMLVNEWRKENAAALQKFGLREEPAASARGPARGS